MAITREPSKKTGYRMISIAAIGTFLVAVLSSFLTRHHSNPLSAPQNGAEIAWDACRMWVNYGPMHNLAAMVVLGASLFFAVQGLRARSGPRWFALAAVFSLVLVIEDIWWQISCGGPISAALIGIWYCSIAIMFMYHAVHPTSADWPQGHRIVAACYRAVVFSFMALLSFWIGLYQLALVTLSEKLHFAAEIIGHVQGNIAFPAHLLLLGAVALGSYRRVAWSRSTTEERV